MTCLGKQLMDLKEPRDYFHGLGREALPTPTEILLFARTTRAKLQQRALQNRSHHRCVLMLNVQTPGQVHLDHLALPLHPGEALLVLPFQFHHFTHLRSDDLRWLFCTFELANLEFLEPLRNQVLRMGADSRSAWERLLGTWLRCDGDEVAPELLQTALLHLLIALKAEPQPGKPRLPARGGDVLVATVNRMLLARRGPATAEEIAGALGLSASRLRVRFRASAGVALGAYVQNYRINRAMALLRNSRHPLAEVAEEAGFNSPQAFSRAFRSATGWTPRAYRAQPDVIQPDEIRAY